MQDQPNKKMSSPHRNQIARLIPQNLTALLFKTKM